MEKKESRQHQGLKLLSKERAMEKCDITSIRHWDRLVQKGVMPKAVYPLGPRTRPKWREDEIDTCLMVRMNQPPVITEAVAARIAAMKAQPRKAGRFIDTGKAKKAKKIAPSVAAKPTKPRGRPRKHAAANTADFEVTA
jgi:hypothetical protein